MECFTGCLRMATGKRKRHKCLADKILSGNFAPAIRGTMPESMFNYKFKIKKTNDYRTRKRRREH